MPNQVGTATALAFKSEAGWLSAQPIGPPNSDGYFEQTRTEVGSWETFQTVPVGDALVMIRTEFGSFWAIDEDGRLVHVTDPRQAGVWRVLRQPTGQVAIQDVRSALYLTADVGDAPGLYVRGSVIAEWESFAVPEPPKPPTTTRPMLGAVRVEGRALRDDGGCWPFLSATWFLAAIFFRHFRQRFLEDLAYFAAHGVDVVRILAAIDWPGADRDIDPRTPDHDRWIIDTIRAVYAGGLRTQLTLFGGTHEWGFRDQGTRRQYVRVLCRRMRAADIRHMIAWIDICNEPGHPVIGPVSVSDLRELAGIVREELGDEIVVALGAPHDSRSVTNWGEDAEGERAYRSFMGWPANATTPHFDRGWHKRPGEHWGRNARQPYHTHWFHDRQARGRNACACIDDEPAGDGGSAQSGGLQDELKIVGVQRAIRTAAWLSGNAATCWHTDPGVNITGSLADRRMKDASGLPGLGSARAFLPGDVANFKVINWRGDASIRRLEGVDGVFAATGRGPVRGHTLVDGARVVLHDFCFLAGPYRWQATTKLRLKHFIGVGLGYEERAPLTLVSGEFVSVSEVGDGVTDHIWVGDQI